MKILSRLKNLAQYLPSVSTVLNLGGTALVGTGLLLLPIDISYRLILMGIFSLVLWRTLNV